MDLEAIRARCSQNIAEIVDNPREFFRVQQILRDRADLLAEVDRLLEVMTIPNITPDTTSSSMFIRTLQEHERGQPVNTQDLINALMWRVANQRREIARLHEKGAHSAEGKSE